jgi:hypothetical protein
MKGPREFSQPNIKKQVDVRRLSAVAAIAILTAPGSPQSAANACPAKPANTPKIIGQQPVLKSQPTWQVLQLSNASVTAPQPLKPSERSEKPVDATQPRWARKNVRNTSKVTDRVHAGDFRSSPKSGPNFASR